MRFTIVVLVLGIVTFLSASPEERGVPAAEALKRLKEGNQRFVEERVIRPDQTYERVMKISEGQHPIASVLSCSDSRVPTEMVFDQGFGNLFVVRVAGNVADTDEMGSLEYGAEHLGTELIVVLGHTHCGAITAVAKGISVNGHMPALIDNIIPAVKKAREEGVKEEGLVERSVELNVFQSIEDLLTKSEIIRHRVRMDRLTILGAVYDLATGRVKWMGEHPDQAKFLNQVTPVVEKKVTRYSEAESGPDLTDSKQRTKSKPEMDDDRSLP